MITRAFTRHELVVRTTLDDAAFFEDQNDVGVADRAESMGDHKRRAPLQQLVKVFLRLAPSATVWIASRTRVIDTLRP